MDFVMGGVFSAMSSYVHVVTHNIHIHVIIHNYTCMSENGKYAFFCEGACTCTFVLHSLYIKMNPKSSLGKILCGLNETFSAHV